MKPMYRRMLVVACVALVTFILFRRFGGSHYLTLEYIKAKSISFEQQVAHNYPKAVLIYFAISTLLTSIALPVTGLWSMVGGFVFGVIPALIYTVIAMTIGSVIYVIFARKVLYNVLETRYMKQLERFNDQVEHYGYNYLVALHLLVILPFFVINSLAAVAHVPLYAVAWTTAIGVIPGTLLYILAGRELSVVTTTEGIFKPHIVILMLLLACIIVLPMVMRHLQKRYE